jgi:hypothetical protein
VSKFDTIFGNLATQLIDRTFGTDAVVSRETATYDSTTGDNTLSTTDHSISISPPAPINRNRLGDGSLFQRDDITCLVARQGLSIVPNPTTDKLVWRDDTYQIVAVRPLASGDLDAAYEMVCRR